MPSALQAEFPWLEPGKLASYYEAGCGIEGEFVVSWDVHEERFADLLFVDHPSRESIVHFLGQLRAAGFDRTLRAGQSVYTFILSRSRRHGLRHGQAYIAFDFMGDEMRVTVGDGTTRKVSNSDIAMTPEIETLLHELEAYAID
jgi:hypothetical protein